MSKIPIYMHARPGGYIKGLKRSVSASGSKPSMSLAHSREDRIDAALDDEEWGCGTSTTGLDESDLTCDDMLAITFSCVMLMASASDEISEEYFIWAENYLSCIKDEGGNYPTNVQGILNHIEFLRPGKPRSPTGECKCSEYVPDSETQT